MHGEGGMPAEAERAIHRGFVLVAFVVEAVYLQDGAVTTVGPFPRHGDAARGYLQVNLAGVIGARDRVDLVGEGCACCDEAEDEGGKQGGYMVHGANILL